MKRILSALVLASDLGCGSGGGGSSNKLANFQGTVWNGTITTTVTCSGAAPQSGQSPYAVAFSQGTDADLQYTSPAGCVYKFSVSGNTASLSNPPVTCSATFNGVIVTSSWTSYTVATSDGHNLSINAGGSGTTFGATCPFTQSGNATR